MKCVKQHCTHLNDRTSAMQSGRSKYFQLGRAAEGRNENKV